LAEAFPDLTESKLSRKLIPIAVSAALLVALAAPGTAAAAQDELESSWATVNACGAGQLGARAQLAGDGSANEMSVRFTAQWLSPNGWLPLAGAATSPWQSAGSAEYTWGQAGWTYSVSAPAGKTYQLRVVAEMSWGNRTATHVTGPCNITG
jgi:hypothetical protein